MPYIFLVLLAAFGFSSLSQTYRNPVTTNFGCADPALLKLANNSFYMACTGGRFPVRKSDDLMDWRWMNKMLVNPGSLDSWAKSGRSWAPEITRINGRYVAYYTQNSTGNKGAIGVSWTSDIERRPFVAARKSPLLRNDGAGGVIDPSHFYDPVSKKHFILYKIDGNSSGKTTYIRIHQLNSNGNGLVGSPKTLKVGGRRFHDLVEGQDLIRKGGYYYLFYSHGGYTNTYEVRVARSRNLFGPYSGDRRILDGSSIFRAPGHGKVVTMPGKWLYFYHAYDNRINDNRRYTMIDEIHWKDGWPLINNGYPSSGHQYVPASTHSFFHKVTVRWNAVKLKNPHYSFDVIDANGKRYAPCLNAGIIRGNRSVDFDGLCRSKSGSKKFSLSTKVKVRVCAAENGRWSGAHRRVKCTSYKNLYNRVSYLKFK